MQNRNWNDIRYLLALKRGGTLSAAAKLLGVDDTTVSRRLSALQKTASVPLFHRLSDGTLQLSEEGAAAVEHAEHIEHQVEEIDEIFGAQRYSCTGVVRITSVPVVINHLLTPHIGSLLELHPQLRVELIPDSRDLNLNQREADLAIRLARPVSGGTLVKTRKLGSLQCSVYAARQHRASKVSGLNWIGYDDGFSHLAPQRWMKRRVAGGDGELSGLQVHDAETALQAVLAGAGRTVLPDLIAAGDRRLRVVPTDGVQPPSRELWLMTLASQAKLRRIAEVVNWIDQILTTAPEQQPSM